MLEESSENDGEPQKRLSYTKNLAAEQETIMIPVRISVVHIHYGILHVNVWNVHKGEESRMANLTNNVMETSDSQPEQH